jgi:hypothetical protein
MKKILFVGMFFLLSVLSNCGKQSKESSLSELKTVDEALERLLDIEVYVLTPTEQKQISEEEKHKAVVESLGGVCCNV